MPKTNFLPLLERKEIYICGIKKHF